MEDNEKIKKVGRNPRQYNIDSLYNKDGKDLKTLLEEIFINYCIDEFKKVG